MVARILFSLFLSVSSLLSCAQALRKMEAAAMNTSRITLATPDSVSVFSLLPTHTSVNIQHKNHYTWYGSNQIRMTQGGYSGRLLHGEYTSFTKTHHLLEQGAYGGGLKTGT